MNEIEASQVILDAAKGLQKGGENLEQIGTDFLGFGVSLLVETKGKEATATLLRSMAASVDKFDLTNIFSQTTIN
ncbi:MAG: hypothetical protein JAY90_07225 [Candidatus Thiodiazotropha lotti]|nr:hypothetical protein [Candidatus Thiodiazotropha lotti]ODB94866.1 hypothetical protein A3197_19220 [Candidatus Thiodiazotropha endoloripes]